MDTSLLRHSPFKARWADMDDVSAITLVMEAAIDRLQSGLLSDEQIAASHQIMGLDTQLIKDGTYLIVEANGVIAGCGGWSWRSTLYGGDHSSGLRDPARLDPGRDPAKIRAMYTNPDFARQGVGRRVLQTCEEAALKHGFTCTELMATLSGKRLYEAAGYRQIDSVEVFCKGVTIPLVKMNKELRPKTKAL